LVEVMVAMALFATSLVAVAQLVATAIGANIGSHTTTFTTALAAQKLEQLRNDSALTSSPPDALEEDTPDYVDYLDASGNAMEGRSPPDAALYVRRWSVEPLPADPANTVVLRVLVGRVGRPASRDRLPGEARLATMRTRVAP
jgi:type II secretory pathway pseudopilin PulG